jgi:dihydrofolate synthase/folylpolyglutamate synthase
MAKTQWPGRLQWVTWQGQRLLVDGAHNPAGAIALRRFVDTHGDTSETNYGDRPIVWVVGMIGTKDHAEVLQELLRPGDQLHLVPVPEHEPVALEQLAAIAQQVCPELALCQTYPDLFTGLKSAIQKAKGAGDVPTPENLIVLSGSLYLLGDFYKHLRQEATT